MQNIKKDKNTDINSSFTNYRVKNNESSSSESSDTFKDAVEDSESDNMSGSEGNNGAAAAADTNSKVEDHDPSINSEATPENETAVKNLASDIIYPKLKDTTKIDDELLKALPQISALPNAKINSLKRMDNKPEDTLRLYRALNGNPANVGFDAKNFTDMKINNVTLNKAIRVGNLESTITDINESMAKMLANSKKALSTAEESKNLVESALKAVNDAETANKTCQEALQECQKLATKGTEALGEMQSLNQRISKLEGNHDPNIVIQRLVAMDQRDNFISKNIDTALNENSIIKQVKTNHNGNLKTIGDIQEKLKSSVDQRQLERRNEYELRILEFRPDPTKHGFSGDFERADESVHLRIANEIISEIYPRYDPDDTVSVKPLKYANDRKEGEVTWRPYRLIIRFDNTSVVDKIFRKNKNLKADGNPEKTKYIVAKPKTPAEQQRDRELRLRVLSKNLAVPVAGQSWILARNPDGSRGPVLKANSELQHWLIFNEGNYNAAQIKKATDLYATENPTPEQQEEQEQRDAGQLY